MATVLGEIRADLSRLEDAKEAADEFANRPSDDQSDGEFAAADKEVARQFVRHIWLAEQCLVSAAQNEIAGGLAMALGLTGRDLLTVGKGDKEPIYNSARNHVNAAVRLLPNVLLMVGGSLKIDELPDFDDDESDDDISEERAAVEGDGPYRRTDSSPHDEQDRLEQDVLDWTELYRQTRPKYLKVSALVATLVSIFAFSQPDSYGWYLGLALACVAAALAIMDFLLPEDPPDWLVYEAKSGRIPKVRVDASPVDGHDEREAKAPDARRRRRKRKKRKKAGGS